MASRPGNARRRGVPWWTPLLGLAVLAAGVAAAATLPGRSTSSAHGVLGARDAVTRAVSTKRAAVTTAPAQTATTHATPPALRPGVFAAEHSVRVLDVVGSRIFWVGRDRGHSTLVHLQGNGTRWSIRPGERITFTATVARNHAGVARAWGLTRREGLDRFDRRGIHFEVYGPGIRFLCVLRCTRGGRGLPES